MLAERPIALAFGAASYRSVTSADAADPRGHPGRGDRRRARQPAAARVLPGRVRAPRGRRDVRGHRVRRQGPAQEPPRRRGADARAGPRRGVRRRHGQSTINFNTVWTSIFEPLPTFGFLDRLGKESEWGARHDAAVPRRRLRRLRRRAARRLGGAQLEAGRPGHGPLQLTSTTRTRRPTTTRCSPPTSASGASRPTSAASPTSRVVKANQLMPKPTHLTWEEAAVNALCNSHQLPHARRPARRPDEAGRRRADLGRHRRHRRLRRAVRAQRRRHPGRRRVVAREGRAAATSSAVEAVIDRKAEGYQFWTDEHTQDERSGAASARRSAARSATTPTSCSSTPAARPWAPRSSRATRGGTIVTCAATSRLHDRVRQPPPLDEAEAASPAHFANYTEAWAANQLIAQGKIQPMLSAVHPLDEVGEAAHQVHHNQHEGKIGVLCLAPEEGLGIDDPEPSASDRRGQDHALPPPRPEPRAALQRQRRRPATPRAGARHRRRMLLTEIDHVAIAVSDLDAAIDYYRGRSARSSTTARSSRATASRRRC